MPTFYEPSATSALLAMPSPGIARKTQRVVGIALIALLIVLFLPLQAIIFLGFSKLEQRTIAGDVERAINAVNDERQELLRVTRDSAARDDVYAFAQGRGDGDSVIRQSLNQSSFETNRLNLVMILDPSGKVLAYQTHQLDAARGTADDAEVLRRVRSSGLLSQIGPDRGATELIMLPGEPLILSAHPILTSGYAGPSAGTMIMGRTIDAARITELGAQLRLDLQILRIDQPTTSNTLKAIVGDLSRTNAPIITPLNMDSVAGYGMISSAAGAPALLIQVSSDREIMETGRTTAIYTLIAFGVAGLIAMFSLTTLLNQLVLERLVRLIEGVKAIGSDRDLGHRVALDGNDELSLLSNTIDETMHALEQAEHERRESEAQRQQMWEDVIASRRNFLATVSHELRTPLTPIRGYADLMLHGIGGPITPDQQHFLHVIHQNSRRMEAMVNDLLIMGQLDAGKIELRIERMDVDAAVLSVLTMLEQQIAQQQVTVTTEIPPDLPPVRADAHRLDQILANLITNAVKYTRVGGHVQIQASRVGEDRVEVAVHDTGIGMSATEMERLFTPFYRADSVLSAQTSGTGLGLSITRSLVELHGGTISVQSAPG
ncbi:MAG: CHASE4 domain-containing protein, partial [Chloroflexales bacterium]